jgi:hypothetical protein
MTLEAVGVQEEKSERRLPMPVAVLLVAAIVDAWLIASWQAGINSFPSAMPRLVLHVAEYASDFLIAAALMGGSRRWSGGRRWFVAAAALFALHGILALAQVEWLAWLTQGNLVVTDQLQAQLSALSLAVALLGLLAPLAVVVALWRARPGPIRIGGLRAWLIVVTALVGVLATAAHLAFEGAFAFTPNEGFVAIVDAILSSGLSIALTLLALTALATMPRGGGLGNLLIAGGVGVALGATGWVEWFQSQGQLQDLPPRFFDLVYTVPAGVAVIGMLVMAGGVVVERRPLE